MLRGSDLSKITRIRLEEATEGHGFLILDLCCNTVLSLTGMLQNRVQNSAAGYKLDTDIPSF